MMIRLFACLACCAFCNVFADEVVWQGQVHADGTPTKLIHLKLDEQYQIKASNYINLGKWVQEGVKLANDPCFEFSDKTVPNKIECLRNSAKISICDGTYHYDHVYLSEPFTAKQNRIFFWVVDTDYDDNTGAFDVEIIHKK